jgi:Zn-dependent protease
VYRSPASETLGEIGISLAGPLAGFLLAAAICLIIVAAGYGNHIIYGPPWGLRPWVDFVQNPRLAELLNKIFFISVVWGLVNLLPIHPLDGGQIAREIALWLTPRDGIRYSLVLSIIAAVGMAAFGMQQWHDWFVAIFFGMLAFSNYSTLQAYSG